MLFHCFYIYFSTTLVQYKSTFHFYVNLLSKYFLEKWKVQNDEVGKCPPVLLGAKVLYPLQSCNWHVCCCWCGTVRPVPTVAYFSRFVSVVALFVALFFSRGIFWLSHQYCFEQPQSSPVFTMILCDNRLFDDMSSDLLVWVFFWSLFICWKSIKMTLCSALVEPSIRSDYNMRYCLLNTNLNRHSHTHTNSAWNKLARTYLLYKTDHDWSGLERSVVVVLSDYVQAVNALVCQLLLVR